MNYHGSDCVYYTSLFANEYSWLSGPSLGKFFSLKLTHVFLYIFLEEWLLSAKKEKHYIKTTLNYTSYFDDMFSR